MLFVGCLQPPALPLLSLNWLLKMRRQILCRSLCLHSTTPCIQGTRHPASWSMTLYVPFLSFLLSHKGGRRRISLLYDKPIGLGENEVNNSLSHCSSQSWGPQPP